MMEIEEIKEYLFVTDYGVPTLVLGDGSWKIADVVFNEGNMSGIAFSLTEKGEIGREFLNDTGKRVDDWGARFQILSTSKESLTVLRDAVDNAIEEFDKILETTNTG